MLVGTGCTSEPRVVCYVNHEVSAVLVKLPDEPGEYYLIAYECAKAPDACRRPFVGASGNVLSDPLDDPVHENTENGFQGDVLSEGH